MSAEIMQECIMMHFNDTEYLIPTETKNAFHSYYNYARKRRNAQIIMKRLKENGESCGTFYPILLYLQGAFVQLGYKEGDIPVTEELSKTTFAIPVFPYEWGKKIQH